MGEHNPWVKEWKCGSSSAGNFSTKVRNAVASIVTRDTPRIGRNPINWMNTGHPGSRCGGSRRSSSRLHVSEQCLNEAQVGSLSLNQLKIQGDAYAVDEHDALIQQLLVGDLRVNELPEGLARADELDGLGSLFGRGRELVQH
jgi:hypothetical protein